MVNKCSDSPYSSSSETIKYPTPSSLPHYYDFLHQGGIDNECQEAKEIRAASGEKDEIIGGEIGVDKTRSEESAEDNDAGGGGEPSDRIEDEQAKDEDGDEEGSGQAAGDKGEQGRVSSERGSLDKGRMVMVPPLVITEIAVVTFKEGEKV